MSYQVMSELTPREYTAHKASIADSGILVPVEFDENGVLLDGHHRVRAWQEMSDYPRLIQAGWSEEQKCNHARQLNVLRRQLSKAKSEQVMVEMRRDGATLLEVAEAVGMSYGTANAVTNGNFSELISSKSVGKDGKARPMTYALHKPRTVFDTGELVELDPHAAEATVAVRAAVPCALIRDVRVTKINEISQGKIPLATAQRFPGVYADPPGRYEHSRTVGREIENQCPTVALDGMCTFAVDDIATTIPSSFCGRPPPKLGEAMQVIDAKGVRADDTIGLVNFRFRNRC